MKKVETFFGYDWTSIQQLLVTVGINIILAILIFVVGFWLATYLGKIVRKILEKSNTDDGLTTFLTSLSIILLKALVLVTGLSQLGIAMTSFVALLASAGLAIGLAFSGTLSNFAGGVMILIFKPFKIGETIRVMGEIGEVEEIQIFNTWLHTSDNKVIILPNGPVANGVIVNYSREENRRIELVFGIDATQDLQKTKNILHSIAQSKTDIFQDPPIFVGFGELKDGLIQIHLKAWTSSLNYTRITFELHEEIYTLFQQQNIKLLAEEVKEIKKSKIKNKE
jgi:small conductance mechanosensitive channel